METREVKQNPLRLSVEYLDGTVQPALFPEAYDGDRVNNTRIDEAPFFPRMKEELEQGTTILVEALVDPEKLKALQDGVEYIQAKRKREKKPKPEIRIKTVIKEPELSDRQKKYNGWLEEAIELKKALYQVWPTHIEVQGGRVYKSAGDLMALCTSFKHSMKHAPGALAELHTGMKLQALQNIAANIRFLERLDAIEKKIEDNGELVQERTHSVEVGGLHGSDFPFDQLH